VVGLVLYILLSRAGPLGTLGLLFTPSGMAVAQFVLATPIITALAHRAIEGIWAEFGPALQMDGASRLRSIPHLLAIGRPRPPSWPALDERSPRWARSSSWAGTSPDIPGR
jgi:tungstate transport system permease protein